MWNLCKLKKSVNLPGSAAGSPSKRTGQHVLLLSYSKSTWICTFQSITACCHQTYPVWNSVKPIAFHVSCINPSTMPVSIFKSNQWLVYQRLWCRQKESLRRHPNKETYKTMIPKWKIYFLNMTSPGFNKTTSNKHQYVIISTKSSVFWHTIHDTEKG